MDNAELVPQIATARLRLRPFKPRDAEGLFFVLGDPELILHNAMTPLASIGAAHACITDYAKHYGQSGYGLWAVIDTRQDELVGVSGLMLTHDSEDVQLAYAIRSDHSGNGYATEAALARIKHAFEELGLSKIVAVIAPGNDGSQKVACKIGMVKDGPSQFVIHRAIESTSWSHLTGRGPTQTHIQVGPHRTNVGPTRAPKEASNVDLGLCV